ncbi:TPA: NAD(P)H-dependent oxidoreductase [Stenotrophomonas maltophilia]|uniref:NAD(P)H-dependent oxidoreductase n=1 Tax=Stenotrophomonas TaxID=40323 RepID=UPI00066A189E|nr:MULTISPECIES: NAD(P)H-dependent oxidoreductase [Stenotrophomonas]MBN4993355.1 NAD(P)H-dependent oxidoreductase [Stenotrophomonas maltophilia]MCI1148655.1 NAD(P)H-dependent oxidoreductase [Stenotrophomonas maltophilia]MDH2181498.1 NAD(P)H-dependent oxidoreductase [Stenotrophomonas sp. GD03654]HEL3159571.1 NAD(P)H-dependent oxidoreductase [Stenotrophomonas maltophilia]
MRALILLAHPEPRSFNAHLATHAAEQLRHENLQVDVVDLYAEGFDPLEAADHHPHRLHPDHFDPQREQRHSAEQGQLPAEVQRHLRLLRAADLLILQFPLWWFAAPAMLKGWLDRVLVYGPMYNSRHRHERGVMQGKRALLSVTTGSSARACAVDGREGDTRLLLWPLMYSLRYVGFEVMEPFVVHGVRSGLPADRVQAHDKALAAATSDYRERLARWRQWPTVPFNDSDDFEDGVVLRADATAHSPFIRHRDAG